RNIDFLVSYTKEWTDFSLAASAGGNTRYSKAANVTNASKPGVGLVVPNLFTVNNISSTALNYSNNKSQRGVNSLYATANIGWRESIFLDLTARNDWASTLPSANR